MDFYGDERTMALDYAAAVNSFPALPAPINVCGYPIELSGLLDVSTARV